MSLRHVGLMLLLMACGFAVVGQLYVTIPLIGDVGERFGVEPDRAALAGSAFGFAYAAGFLLLGPLSDRYGRKRMIVIGLAATALATVLVGMAGGFGLLLSARAIQGLAASIFPPVALSLVTEELPPPQRPLGVSLMSFAFLGAAPLAQMFAARTNGGLPAIMFETAPLYLLGAVGLLFVVKANGGALGASPQGQASRLSALLRDPGIIAAWIAALTVLFGFVSFYSGVQIVGSEIGVDPQTLRLAGLPPLLLTLAAAPATRLYGAPVTARLGMMLAALALAFAAIAQPWALILASVVLSAGIALAVPGLIATIASRATSANRGLALAIYSFALFLGASFASPVTQMLAGFGTLPLWLLAAMLLATATLGVTATIRRHQPPTSS